MDRHCEIVRDLLPLYTEGLVSEGSRQFVEEHLKTCEACQKELETLQNGMIPPKTATPDAALPLTQLKRMLAKGRRRTVALTLALVLAVGLLAACFPIYRLIPMAPMASYYTGEELTMLVTSGSLEERREAEAVLRLADEAFHDVSHTRAENEERYGPLARYTTDIVQNAAYSKCFLHLCSAHLEEQRGSVWVYYSTEAFDETGESISGSWRVYSLWTVERQQDGSWRVTAIKEHP